LGDRKGVRPVKSGCWFVGGDDLTGTLHVFFIALVVQLSTPPPSPLGPIKSRMETLVPANPGPPGKTAIKMERLALISYLAQLIKISNASTVRPK